MKLSDRDRRALRLLALVAVPAMLFAFGVRPWLSHMRDLRDRIATERSTLARELALVQAMPTASVAGREAAAAVRSTEPRLFVGRDDVIASAELASYVGGVGAESRVLVQDAGTRPSVISPTGVRTLRVELRGESDLEGIVGFLNALETGEKLVRIDRVDISRAAGGRGEEEGVETLSLSAMVAGFALGDPPRDTLPRRGPTPTGGRQP